MNTDPNNEATIRLLLVEDDKESRESIEYMLAQRGISVHPVEDGVTALACLAKATYDIVVSDVRLGPTMSGVDLLGSVRERSKSLPVILITGFDSLQSAIGAVRLGAQDYILKPFDHIEDLLQPVRKAVHTYRLETQFRRLQEELKMSERRFRHVLENAVDVIFEVDTATGAFEYVSPSCREILGFSPEELRQHGVKELLELVDTQTTDQFLNLETQRMHNAEVQFRHAVHGTRWLSINAIAVHDPATGRPRSIVGSARDVTDLRRMKEQEREYRQALDRAERMQSLAVLAGGVAHDLNNILMPILTLPDVINEELAESHIIPPTLTEDLEVIARSGARAACIARDLLSLSRSQFPERRPMRINQAIEAVLQSGTVLELGRTHPDIRIERSLSAQEPLVNGSENHLFQALLNLVVNAIEAMPKGGVLRIATDTYRFNEAHIGHERIEPGEYVRVIVADTGHGISPEAIDRVFEPFRTFRGNRKRSGSGLGLAVVYGVAKGHEGYVDLTSTVDQGTEFRLYFPVCNQPLSAIEPDEEETAAGGDERLLLVDDESLPREMSARMLRQLGYEVELAENGREAIERIADSEDASPYALVLLDMVMEEDFDGLDTYQTIARIRPRQRCMLISGFSDGDRVHQAQKLGAGGFLQKPFSMQRLARAVRNEIDVPGGEVAAGTERDR